MSKTGKTPDGKRYLVTRPILPAGMGSKLADEATDSGSSSASGFGPLIVRAVFLLTLGLLLLPVSLLFRLVFRRWTVDAQIAGERKRWRARSRADAGKGVEAVAGALARGESVDALPGLTPV